MAKNSINAQLRKLIDSRENDILSVKADNDRDIISYDGIVDEEVFFSLSQRVLYLLKDPNGANPYEDGNGDICRDLYESALATSQTETAKTRLGTMWRYLCIWQRIIEEPDTTLSDCEKADHSFDVDGMREYLRHAAVINVKKRVGVGSVDKRDIWNAANCYFDLIEEEIRLIQPTLVICGQTFQFLENKYNVESHKLPYGKKYFVHEGCVYLDYWHPSARFGYEGHFNRFKDIYTALQAKLSHEM